jgi:hypothetical protein
VYLKSSKKFQNSTIIDPGNVTSYWLKLSTYFKVKND